MLKVLALLTLLMSAAAQRPFVKLAAAGLTPDGLEAGFARAEEGTLYLDEVTSLPQPAQFALLELLEVAVLVGLAL